MWVQPLLVITALVFVAQGEEPSEVFVVTYEWDKLDFTWPDDSVKVKFLASSQYVPENITITSVKVWGDRLYVTLPRLSSGVPATLACIPLPEAGSHVNASPKLQPFPSWEMQQVGNCSALQNVQSIEIHPDGFMWVVDSGSVNTLSQQPDNRCPPKLVIFDLSTIVPSSSSKNLPHGTDYNHGNGREYGSQAGSNSPGQYNPYRGNQGDYNFHNNAQPPYNSQEGFSPTSSSNTQYGNTGTGTRGVRIFTFGNPVVSRDSDLMDIVLDTDGDGYSYISDASETDPGIIVYSWKENRAWKVRDDRSMRANPNIRSLSVNGVNVEINKNVAGLALTPIFKNGDRYLYYSPLSSYSLFSVPTSVLRDENRAITEASRYVKTEGQKTSISQGMAMDSRGVLYYGLVGLNAIARWDTNLPFDGNQHMIAQDSRLLQWPAGFGFNSPVGNLTVVSNRFQNFLARRVDLNNPNFRIITAYTGSKSYLSQTKGTEYSTSTQRSTEIPDRSSKDEREMTHHTQHKQETESAAGRIEPFLTTMAALTFVKILL